MEKSELAWLPTCFCLCPSSSFSFDKRARADAEALQMPVTETLVNCSFEFPIIPGTLGLKDVSQVEFMA
jgi:hypothetical protein